MILLFGNGATMMMEYKEEKILGETRYFLTVDWCERGRRGVFCNGKGQSQPQKGKHTQEEIQKILGPFWMILSPKSIPLTEKQLGEYTQWYPLEEYSSVWGIAEKEERP
jgi:hypothetical protein